MADFEKSSYMIWRCQSRLSNSVILEGLVSSVHEVFTDDVVQICVERKMFFDGVDRSLYM